MIKWYSLSDKNYPEGKDWIIVKWKFYKLIIIQYSIRYFKEILKVTLLKEWICSKSKFPLGYKKRKCCVYNWIKCILKSL